MMHRFTMRACAVAAAGIVLGTWAVTAASASAGGRAMIHHGAPGRGGALRLAGNERAAGVAAAVAN